MFNVRSVLGRDRCAVHAVFLTLQKMTEIKKRLEDVPKRPGHAIVPKGLSIS